MTTHGHRLIGDVLFGSTIHEVRPQGADARAARPSGRQIVARTLGQRCDKAQESAGGNDFPRTRKNTDRQRATLQRRHALNSVLLRVSEFFEVFVVRSCQWLNHRQTEMGLELGRASRYLCPFTGA